MENHPSYAALSGILPKYPRAAGSIFQVYNDLTLSQRWTDLSIVELKGVSRAAITGKRPNTDAVLNVVPCSLAETLSFEWLSTAFAELSNPSEIYLGITSDDSSIVYYKLTSGLAKPSI